MGFLGKLGPFARIGMFWRVLTRKDVPLWCKGGFISTATAYFTLTGGWIPFAGWLDDLIVLPVLAWAWGSFIPGAARLMGIGKKKD